MINKNIKTTVAAISLILVLVLCFSFNAFAYEEATYVTPRWNSIAIIDLDLNFSENTGNVAAMASKQSTSNFIEGTVYLYKWEDNDWVYIDEWYKSKSVGTLGISEDFSAEKGVTYKAVFTVTAYTNGVPETETVEYSETCPKN